MSELNDDVFYFSQDAQSMQEQLNVLRSMFPEYDQDVSYKEDDYVIEQGVLYVALADTELGPFDPDYWEEVSVARELRRGSRLARASVFTSATSSVSYTTANSWRTVYTYNGTGAYYKSIFVGSAIVEVIAGQTVELCISTASGNLDTFNNRGIGRQRIIAGGDGTIILNVTRLIERSASVTPVYLMVRSSAACTISGYSLTGWNVYIP